MTATVASPLADINPEVGKRGEKLCHAIMEGGTGGWANFIGKDVKYYQSSATYGLPDQLLAEGSRDEMVVTEVTWSGDNPGKVFLLLSQDGAKTIVAFLNAMMGEGSTDPATTVLDAGAMDGYSEGMNNFFGQAAQQARSETASTIKTAVAGSHLVDFRTATPTSVLGEEEYLLFTMNGSVEKNKPFTIMLFMTRSVTGVPPDSESPGDQPLASRKSPQTVYAPKNLALALKLKLPLVVPLANKMLRMELIQSMTPGTIIEFRKMAGDSLDVLAGNIKVAEGQVIITTNQCFGIKIQTLVDPRILGK
ncbi:MAG: FliM/FliN family flagellar motor switch protein [Planctomycetota bacterium]|jgi:flagellar motor switch/type III secretory pathway protein FliN|nr:FliM/FliN family flagellar motor switch protein [Planctomycetota bacterium]